MSAVQTLHRMRDKPQVMKNLTGWIPRSAMHWLTRVSHFDEGRLEQPGGLLAQSNRLIQAAGIVGAERSRIEAKQYKDMRSKRHGRKT